MLAEPYIVGPVTPCNRKIRVRGMLVGAEISLLADGGEIGKDTAKKTDDLIPLNFGVQLSKGQNITAIQRRDGDESAVRNSFKVTAAPTVNQLGKLHTLAPVIECSTCLWIGGVVPGAEVALTINNRPPVTIISDWAVADIQIPTGIPRGATIKVKQTACGVAGPEVTLPETLMQDPEGPPPAAPTAEPLVACQQELHLYNVRPGATVHLEHNGMTRSFSFGYTEAIIWLDQGLDPAHPLILRQEYTAGRCSLIGEPQEYSVSDELPDTPRFTHPVCAGDDRIELSHLVPGATLHIFGDDENVPFLIATAYDVKSIVLLPEGWNAQHLSVRQTVCPNGPRSHPGKIKVTPAGNTQDPVIVEPLHDCAAAVAVQGITPDGVAGLAAGTYIRVLSNNRDGAIGEGFANGDQFYDVSLWFDLEEGDDISIESIRCGLPRSTGSSTTVQRAPEDIRKPVMDQKVDDVGGVVLVKNIVPGTIVEIESVAQENLDPQINGTPIGSIPATRIEMPVPVMPLEPGVLIRARQRLCQRRSDPSDVGRVDDLALIYQDNSTFRICQLMGSDDPGNRPHRNNTWAIRLLGTDLGIPVEHQGRLWLFFGDAKGGIEITVAGPIRYGSDYDPFAWTTDEPEPDGPQLHYVTLMWWLGGIPKRVFKRLHVNGLPELNNFEVPTGGFSYNGRLFLFVAREKVDGKMRNSHLAVSVDAEPSNNFSLLYNVSSTLPNKSMQEFPAGKWLVHVSPTVIRNKDWPGLPSSSGDGLLLFGTALYQESSVFLAWAPLTPGQPPPPPDQWKFFTEQLNGKTWFTLGELQNMTTAQGTIPEPKPLPTPDGIARQGELSVVWSPRLRRWIMGNMSGSPTTLQVVLRTARQPWGPWSDKVIVFDEGDSSRAADNIRPDGSRVFVGLPNEDENVPGNTVPYAPYIIPRWTKFDRSIRELTVFYTLSVGAPPYCSQLMRSRLRPSSGSI